jgi:gliding motility-associated-like protein
VTDNNNCTGQDFIKVNPKDCMKGLFVPSGFTPNKDGKNDLLKANLYGNVKQFKFIIYNRWGEIVFSTSNPLTGWDGTFKGLPQDNAIFVWTCIYQLEGSAVQQERGTVLLVR